MTRRIALSLVLLGGCSAGPKPEPTVQVPVVPTMDRPAVGFPQDTGLPKRLPAIPVTGGPLRITVVYPDSTARVTVRDSSFLFGSLGDGRASLRIDGQPVQVWPNGAWLGWVPFRGDSVVTLTLEARSATDSARLVYRIQRVNRYLVPPQSNLWIDPTSLAPAGRVWWPAGEYLPLSVRASPGARVELQLPGRKPIPFLADSAAEPVAEGLRAFDRDPANLARPVTRDRYRTVIRGIEIAEPPSRQAAAPGSRRHPEGTRETPSRSGPVLVAIKGRDTVRVAWPLRLSLLDTVPLVVELDPDPDRTGRTDGLTKGRTVPEGTYTWFFPAGTRARVRGRINDDLRIALSRQSDAWVAAREARPTRGTTESVIGSVTLTSLPDRVVARVPAGVRLPFQVLEEERSLTLVLYGGRSDVNWLRYGRQDSLIRLVTTRQSSADELEIKFQLGSPVFGYRARWDGADLLLEIRRPPVTSARRPLVGLTLVIDPGHPPLGATGPTGFTEPEANLLVAQQLVPLLEREGARVLLTRNDARPLDLAARVRFADSVDAAALVSIHNNALPDGVNPFTNNGASAFYNLPRALPLARAIQARLVERTGLRDLGVARADLALTRATWMPAVLTEGMFMMIPEQEAALRSPEGRRLYALAVLEGLRQFFAELSTDGRTVGR